MTDFNFGIQERKELFNFVIEQLEAYYQNTKEQSAAPPLDIEAIQKFIEKYDIERPTDPEHAIHHVIDGMKKYTVHTPHPKYFGLYNPRASFPGILADLITATFNPQLAAWSHSPFANEVENYVVKELGKKFGYEPSNIDGVFATGGAEANQTAVLCALNQVFPKYAADGLMSMKRHPLLYCSEEAHHSINKAASTSGLGHASVRTIPIDQSLKMDTNFLKSQIHADLKEGHQPFMLVGTAGITGTGVIEDLPELSEIAKTNNMWFHVDAAYGGGAILSHKLKSYLKGIENSDSITFDAHKWMSLPMSTSLFITSHRDILSRTFRMNTEYMPKEAKDMEIVDPYTHSIQWSRRFIGLKVYLALQMFGWKGFEEVIEYQTEIGDYLRERLLANGWIIKNETPLPVICFTDKMLQADNDFSHVVSQSIIKSGKSWISAYPIEGVPALRACITNYSTTKADIDVLVMELNGERERYTKK